MSVMQKRAVQAVSDVPVVGRSGSLSTANLRCVACDEPLIATTDGLQCRSCGRPVPLSDLGQPDFRLRPSESARREITYKPWRYDTALATIARRERRCNQQRNSFDGSVPSHLTRDQISYIPQANGSDVALDLGCGDGRHKPVLEALGYRYRGADYDGAAADDLVDAHCLPYRDGTFALVLSIAVAEHLAEPRLAFQEAARVLKGGGRFVGTVSFLEPFHDNSFFHMSALGIARVVESSGLVLEDLMPIQGWNVWRAQIAMGMQGAPTPGVVSRLLSLPMVWAFEIYALIGRLIARDRDRHSRDALSARHAGAFFFVARKAGRQ